MQEACLAIKLLIGTALLPMRKLANIWRSHLHKMLKHIPAHGSFGYVLWICCRFLVFISVTNKNKQRPPVSLLWLWTEVPKSWRHLRKLKLSYVDNYLWLLSNICRPVYASAINLNFSCKMNSVLNQRHLFYVKLCQHPKNGEIWFNSLCENWVTIYRLRFTIDFLHLLKNIWRTLHSWK